MRIPPPIRVAAVVAAVIVAVLAACGDEAPQRRPLVYGISGERPGALRDPRLLALGLRHARVVVSWDLAVRGVRPGAPPDSARFPALADEQRRLRDWRSEERRVGKECRL